MALVLGWLLLLLLAVLARLFTSPGARSTSYRLLGAAVLLQLGADIIYAGLIVVGSYSAGLLDLGWMASYLCWGAAALHPSVRSLSEVAPPAACASPAGGCSSWPRLP